MTTGFTHRDDALACEGVPLARIAAEVGTPTYVYSLGAIRASYRAYDHALAGVPHLICASVKANDTLAVLRALVREGSGFDIVSGGELFRALRAGADPRTIVFAGVGKTRDEMAAALDAGILMFNVESPAELEALNAVAGARGRTAPVALRVNPDVDAQTHPYISTGMKKSKFGIDVGAVLEVYARAAALPHVAVVGVDCHIGSQLTSIAPFVDALARVRGLIERLHARGIDPRYLDVGGGLGIPEKPGQMPLDLKKLDATLGAIKQGCGDRELWLEPGRYVVAQAGVLLTRVTQTKGKGAMQYVGVNAGMNALIRPALYGAYHEIVNLTRLGQRATDVVTVVGPICETGDRLGSDRLMPPASEGDVILVANAGAYGYVMSSRYNLRDLLPEILI
jgi:diaminopimelate decarboxylase